MHRLHTAFIVAVAVLGLAGCASQSGDGARAPSASAASSLNRIGTPLDSAIPRHIRNLTFTDSNGRQVRLDDLKGRTVVLSDVMTLCQETCPIDTATVVQTARAEEHPAQGKPPVFISLTVDPARDTPAQLTAYRRLFTDPPSNWQAWTGSSKNVNALWNYFGVWRKRVADDSGPAPHDWRTGKPLSYDIQHSDEVFFIDATGHERFVLEGAPYAPGGTVPKALRAFMNKEGHKNLASPATTAWTKAQAETVLRSLRS